ncbi:MAG: LamG-like jellyroll fold domain-containing protein [Pseudomonadota bacterium]
MILDPCTRLPDRLTRPEMRLSLGPGLPPGGGTTSFNPASALFTNGEKGLVWDFSDPTKLFSDAGVTPATIDGSIGRIVDSSPNGFHGNQATSSSKPAWKTSGGKYYALFDGSDDSFQTGAIDFTGTDKLTIFVGIRKLSDATAGMALELSANMGANNGSFWLMAPQTAGDFFEFRSRGTATSIATVDGHAAPVTRVVTCQGDIASDVTRIIVNGVSVTQTTDQGSGNYGNFALNVGRRNNVSFPFNGQIFALIIIGRTCTAAEILQTEAWINSRTGAF